MSVWRPAGRVAPALALALSLLAPATAQADVAGVGMALPLALPNGLTVSGTVTDASGTPVAGATAGLCRLWYDCFSGFAKTDAGGHWSIQGVAPGTYYVEVLPAYGMNLLSAALTGDGSSSHDLATAAPVAVSTDLAGLDLVMPVGMRITGTVVSPEGAPVEGVTVFASGATASTSAVASDADGAWQAVGLEPGVAYTLQVSPAGTYPSGWFNGTSISQMPGDGPVYTLDDVDIAGVAITLAAGRRVTGHLDGVDGREIVAYANGFGTGATAVVDGAGNFELAGLWPTPVVLTFGPRPVGPLDNEYPYGTWNGQGELLDPAQGWHPVDLSDGDALGLVGVVPVMPAMTGSVAGPDGPLASATVAICDTSDTPVCLQVTTRDDGTWAARNVPANTYRVRAGITAMSTAWHADDGSVTDPALASDVVVGDADVSAVAITLPAGKAIRGWVTGPGGMGVAGVEVTAIPEGRFDDDWGPGPGLTDADGAFTVKGLVPGDYRVCARPPQGSPLLFGCWTAQGWTASYDNAEIVHVVAVDAVAPVVAGLSARLAAGEQLAGGAVPVRVRWTATDDTSGIDHSTVRVRAGTGTWTTTGATTGTSRVLDIAANGTTRWQVGVGATDGSGNPSGLATTAAFTAVRIQEAGAPLSWSRGWSTSLTAAASGGAHRWTQTAGASLTYAFTGRSIGWVAATGPAFGRARVYVDGVLVGTVDLHAATMSWRTVVFARSWAASGSHTLRIVCAGTAGHARVGVDALVVLR